MDKILSNFFLDGAKIIFGSIVVGAFNPQVLSPISWVSVSLGLVAIAIFLAIANLYSKDKEN